MDDTRLPAALAEFECRNNRLAYLGLQQDGFAQAVRGGGRSATAPRAIGVFLGTSTSGVLETELAFGSVILSPAPCRDFRYRGAHNTFSVAAFALRALKLAGPAVVISSACSSSGKVFASAQRAIAAGVIDAAVVGRRGFAVPHDAVSAFIRCSWSRGAGAPVRCGARRHLDR